MKSVWLIVIRCATWKLFYGECLVDDADIDMVLKLFYAIDGVAYGTVCQHI